MTLDWEPPQPRTGWRGEWDKFVGPGQTRAEFWLILIPALLAGLAAPFYGVYIGLGWTPLQLIVAGVMAFDLVGGVLTNATQTAKRWYHRPGQGWRQHLEFTGVHVIHIGLVTGLFCGGDWAYFGVYSVYLLATGLLIARIRLDLQRPVAFLALIGALILNLYVIPPPAGLEWFIPVFYMKLLLSHLVKEMPYLG